MKPNDPFAYQQLAYVYKKQAEVNGAGPDMLGVINNGINYAKKALALRPQSGSDFLTLAELHVMKYLSDGTVNESEKNIINYLNQADTLEELNPRLKWDHLIWETAKLKKAAIANRDQTNTDELKKIIGKIQDLVKKINNQKEMLKTPETPQFKHYWEKLDSLSERMKFVPLNVTIPQNQAGEIINQFSEIQIFTAMPPPPSP